jgi:hypothetical protein
VNLGSEISEVWNLKSLNDFFPKKYMNQQGMIPRKYSTAQIGIGVISFFSEVKMTRRTQLLMSLILASIQTKNKVN